MLQIDNPRESLSKRNFIDQIHINLMKQLLGVRTQTSNIRVLLEIGRVPLLVYATKNSVKNLRRTVKMNNFNPLFILLQS